MSQMDKSRALDALGIAPGASKAQIDAAHNRVRAFWTSDTATNVSLDLLCDLMRQEFDGAHTAALQPESINESTKHVDQTKKPEKIESGKGGGLVWLMGIILAGGFLYQVSHREPERPPTPTTITPPTEVYTPPQQTQPSGNEQPPPFVVPFIHGDDISGRATRWTSGWENVNGGQAMVVWGYSANNDPICKFELYQDGSTWREQRLYEVRYSADRLQVAVQRYQEQGSAATFKDQRNLSTINDVLVQTTIYTFSSDTKLAAVQVDTPFMMAKDGLRFTRSGGAVYAERMPAGGQVNVNGNDQWLNNLFDMWSTFGAPNV